MVRKFKIPYNYDYENFTEILVPLYRDHIDSIYLGPPAVLGSSARPMSKPVTMDSLAKILNFCSKEGIGSYLTLNGEFTPLNTYTSEHASKVASVVKALEGILSGIICTNMYLPKLAMLKEHAPDIKIIASVNSLIMDYDRAKAFIDIAGVDGFIWDRSLNRDPESLATLNTKLKEDYPKILTQIMLNEGCLLNCPYKKAHDQAISALTYVDDEYYDYLHALGIRYPEMCNNAGNINYNYGCRQAIKSNPDLVKTIPDIAPVDLVKYANCADLFKISGRTQSTDWLMNCLSAYIAGVEPSTLKFSDSGLKKISAGLEH